MSDLPTTTDRDGNLQVLGCLERTLTSPHDGIIRLSGEDILVPETEWRESCERNWPALERAIVVTPWIDQGPIGSCTTAATAKMVMVLNYLEGEEVERLAEATLYAWDITSDDRIVKRTKDKGMPLDTGIRLVRHFGIARADETGKNGIPARDWRQQNWPDNWMDLAKLHKGLEWRDNSLGMAYVMSRLASGKPCLMGYNQHATLLCRAHWDDPDSLRPNRFTSAGSWASKPYWHEYTWNEVNYGRQYYGNLSLTTTVAG